MATWYGINYAGTQATQWKYAWNFRNKGSRAELVPVPLF